MQLFWQHLLLTSSNNSIVGVGEEPRHGVVLHPLADLPERPGAREGHGIDEEEKQLEENPGSGESFSLLGN